MNVLIVVSTSIPQCYKRLIAINKQRQSKASSSTVPGKQQLYFESKIRCPA
ncbi:unnamed protein product [Chondrus crispus]|uniref:Uncharacterized protein n=1 Tax=Chondrus crispus TaxID=2769 RepID=R7QDN8_CHOCR|nr:unnamed protein product [Chondrus crispus]CDF36204.1 unnamed protein product [Chondrus crispus]|eukprot:XP_005716023.1 unnamed protein product [Chondrus crispus]